MRLPGVVFFALLLASAACRIVPSLPQQNIATNITTQIKVLGTPLAVDNSPAFGGDSPPPAKRPRPSSPDSPPPAKRPKPNPPDSPTPAEPDSPAASPQTEWYEHVCRGEKLTHASKLDKANAESFAFPIDTRWKGTLEAERKLWGYTTSPFPDCDIDGQYYDITMAYEELTIHDEDTECFRVFHFDPEKVDENGHDVETKDQTYKVGDQVFRATGAHGTFGINVEQGAVIFIDVASARHKAAELWGVEKPPADQLPLLRQMSDLSWGFWYQAHGGSNLGHITKFIVPQIINDITLRLINQALQTYTVPEDQQRLTAVPEWPGISFDVEKEPGKALLGSPNGIAAAYFLSQHKQEIGANKYIHKVTVFRPEDEDENDEPTILYYVQDAPALSPEDENTEDPGQSQGLAGRDLVVIADADLWHDCVCRGEKLTLACKNTKARAIEFAEPIDSPWEGKMEAELKLWGYREEPADSHCNFDDIEPALKALRIGMKSAMEGGNTYCYQVRHSFDDAGNTKDQTYDVNGATFRMTGAYSIIGANAVGGVIFFVDVRSAYRAAEELRYPEIPKTEMLPSLRAISDISWAFWNRVQLKRPLKRRNLGKINYFVVHSIVNKETEQSIKLSLDIHDVPEGQSRVTELPKWPGLIFDVESEAGQAMLGSPNGIAAGYFLSQHKTQIGTNKYVYQVQIFASEWGNGPSMILHVKDAPSPTRDDTNPRKKRSRNKRFHGRDLTLSSKSSSRPQSSSDDVATLAGDDDIFWRKYVCRGEKLTQASMHDEDTAVNFVTAIKSEFDGTMEAEFKMWGYTDYNGKSLYCELDNIAETLNQIGIDAKFKKRSNDGQNECFHLEHGRQSEAKAIQDQAYEVDGTTYRMTGAYSHMGINARDGVVAFLNVRSAERGASMIWKVDKPADSELPRLRQISDLAWAFWKRAHKDGAGLNNINKFLVHDVINGETLELIKMALKSYQVPEGQQRYTVLPKWPGLVFDMETPEGKAMLGSPNGVAAGYFLVQHKTQLGGNKYVHQVTIWKDSSGDEQMIFWVKNSPPPPKEGGQGRRLTSTPDGDAIVDAFGNAGKVVKRSIDGRNIVREHRVLARL